MSVAVAARVLRPLREAMASKLSTIELRCKEDHPLTFYVPETTPVRCLQRLRTDCPLCGAEMRIHHAVAPDARTSVRIQPR